MHKTKDLTIIIQIYLKEKQITTLVASHDINDVLSFSDEVIVIKDKTILEKASPKELYFSPKHKYTAALFGEVNEIEIDGQLQLVYPHQLQVVENSKIQVEVVKSYFKGKHFLIEGKFRNQTVFFENENDMPKASIVYLKKLDL